MVSIKQKPGLVNQTFKWIRGETKWPRNLILAWNECHFHSLSILFCPVTNGSLSSLPVSVDTRNRSFSDAGLLLEIILISSSVPFAQV